MRVYWRSTDDEARHVKQFVEMVCNAVAKGWEQRAQDEAEREASAASDRPTRSEQSLEGAAVNGLTPVGQEGPSE